MTHLISPWVFYWISVLTGLDVTLSIVLCIGFIVMAIMALALLVGESDFEYHKKSIKSFLILMSIMLGIVAFIPSEKTMYTMLIVDQITVENINGLKQTTTELVDYVIEKVDVLLDEQSTDTK